MALKTAPVKISWRQGLLLQRQTTLQQAIMNCLTALSGHAANARCSTVAPQRRHMHHGHTYTYLQPNKRACAYGRRFLRMRSARNCFGAAFSAPAKINFDTPDSTASREPVATKTNQHKPFHAYKHKSKHGCASKPGLERFYVNKPRARACRPTTCTARTCCNIRFSALKQARIQVQVMYRKKQAGRWRGQDGRRPLLGMLLLSATTYCC